MAKRFLLEFTGDVTVEGIVAAFNKAEFTAPESTIAVDVPAEQPSSIGEGAEEFTANGNTEQAA